MRIIAGTVFFALAIGAAADEPAQSPDFSRDALMRTFSSHAIDLPQRPGPNVKFHIGGVEFHALGMDWRLMYLPLAVPLSGSRLTANKSLPDPFELTASFAASPLQTLPSRRDVNAERRRIRRMARSRLDVRSD